MSPIAVLRKPGASTSSSFYVSQTPTTVGVLTVALHSFVDFPLQINACAVLLVTMTGLLVATRLTAEEPA